METLLQDLRYGLRTLARDRSIAVIAILTLALGIGVNSAIFSVVHAVLLRPLPLGDPGRLAAVTMSNSKLNAEGAQPGFEAYVRWSRNARLFESVAAADPGVATLEMGASSRTVRLWRVSSTFLPALRVNPAVGRNFTQDEDRPGANRVALVAYTNDPRVLGSLIRIDGVNYTVIGVMPAGFHVDGRPAGVYVPFGLSPESRQWLPVNVYARLKPGVSVEQATAELDGLGISADRGPFPWRVRAWKLRDFEVRDVRLSLLVLIGAVGFVLLISCANVACLLVARRKSREQEVAVRVALGAGRGRLLRQLLTESTLLAVLGGIAGVGVAEVCVRLVPLVSHEGLPGLIDQTRVDGVVLGFTLALSVLTGLLFGVVPSLMAARRDPYESLKMGMRSTGGNRVRALRYLVVTETALALVLGIGATLLIRTFFYLRDVAPGFRVDGLVVATVNSDRTKFASREQFLAYYEDLARSVRGIPGVKSATFANSLPLSGDNQVMNWPVEGFSAARPRDLPLQWQRTVDTNYFATLQIPLKRGRFFNERDNLTGPKVAIVNEAFVRRFWPNQDPIGKHIGGGLVPVFEVVGVVGDVRHQDSTKEATSEVFFHYQQVPTARVSLALRTDPNAYPRPLMIEPALRGAVTSVDQAQPVTKIAEMRQTISDRIAPKRLSAQLIAVFAGLAALLAVVGIYGVLSFSVSQRTHEIGLRMALGAQAGPLLGMVLRQAALLAGTGAAIGIVAAFGLTRVLKTLIFGVGATDPSTYILVAAGTLSLAILAAVGPAWRASRVDPLLALRDE